MKKFNRRLIRGTNWALAGLLSLLGFSGCNGIIRVEYGSPNADFKVSGRVTDEQGNPLSGVRVVTSDGRYKMKSRPGVMYDHPTGTFPVHDTVYTASNGRFSYRYNEMAPDSMYLDMKFEDPATPPAYESDSVTVGFAKGDLKGAKGWYQGAAKKKVNVTLKRKKGK